MVTYLLQSSNEKFRPTKCKIDECFLLHQFSMIQYNTSYSSVCVCCINRLHEVFSKCKWEQRDGILQCDTVIAYHKDENSSYIIEEYFINGMIFHFHLD